MFLYLDVFSLSMFCQIGGDVLLVFCLFACVASCSVLNWAGYWQDTFFVSLFVALVSSGDLIINNSVIH